MGSVEEAAGCEPHAIHAAENSTMEIKYVVLVRTILLIQLLRETAME